MMKSMINQIEEQQNLMAASIGTNPVCAPDDSEPFSFVVINVKPLKEVVTKKVTKIRCTQLDYNKLRR